MASLGEMALENPVRVSLQVGCCFMADRKALLRAMADKLVPGIPHATRIAILQQTDADTNGNLDPGSGNQHATVLERVMGSDTSRNEVIRKMECKSQFHYIISILTLFLPQDLSRSFDTDEPSQPVRAIRTIRHEQLESQLFLAQKNASLKSGARGLQARKDLKAVEGKVQASREL